jgi:hypothetical protein
MRAGFVFVVGAALAAPAVLAAQGSQAVYARTNALTGFEWRAFNFDSGLSVSRASQWHIPIVAVAPLGRRFSVDVSASYVGSDLTTGTGPAAATESITGFTDTQVRFLYSVQRDRLATTLSFNLPTGQRSVSTSQFAVSGAVGSNFLSFPVATLGTAFGATAGLAYAARAGAWNVGFAGSLRYSGSYEPFADDSLSYSPGMEGRLRLGLDRLLGQRTRVLVGLTGSTFSTDEYSGVGSFVGATWYKPGTRFIGDLALLHLVGRTTVVVAVWDYYRLAGDRPDTSAAATKENVLNAELRVGFPVAARLQLEPTVAFRQYSPGDYRGGRLYSGGLTAHIALSDRLSGQLTGRLDRGWVYAEGRGSADLTGYGFSVLVRFQQ